MNIGARVRQALRRRLFETPAPEFINIWTNQKEPAVTQTYRTRTELEQLRRSLIPGLGIYGLFHAEIGIGEAARRMSRALDTVGYAISKHAISLRPQFEESIEFEVDPSPVSRFDTALIHVNPNTYVHFIETHRIPLEGLIGRRRIGYWAWELPVFPPEWHEAFDKVDEVWTLSAFSASSIAPALRKPVRVVPLAVETTNIDMGEARRAFGFPPDATIFLTAFDFNSRPARKNPAGTIRAFRDAFPDANSEGPLLVVKCHGRGNRGEGFEEIIRQVDADKRIILIDEVLPEPRLRILQAACDAFVSLHRSEGFGLHIAECMGAGKVVIATNFSGNCDFMDAENSLPIPYQVRLLQPGDYFHGSGQWWAEPDHSAAVEAMRLVAARPAQVRRLGENARRHIARHYSYEQTGRNALAALNGTSPPVAF